MVKCKICNRDYEYNRFKGHTRTICNSCMSNTRKRTNKIRCLEYKGGKCELCGYNKSIRALSFHHLDPTKKDFGISGNHGRKWEVIKQELDKCILVCHNCHDELHEKEEQKKYLIAGP